MSCFSFVFLVLVLCVVCIFFYVCLGESFGFGVGSLVLVLVICSDFLVCLGEFIGLFLFWFFYLIMEGVFFFSYLWFLSFMWESCWFGIFCLGLVFFGFWGGGYFLFFVFVLSGISDSVFLFLLGVLEKWF